MDIASSTSAATAAATSSNSGKTAIASDFETFLRMMTTQLKNQDPMNPIDSADYAVQLATFSSVEQQAKTNSLLEAMGAQFGLMGMAQMAGWVGHEARAAAPVWISGDPVSLAPNPAFGADSAVLVVRDFEGNLVNRVNIPASADPLEWEPVDQLDAPLAEGTYTFQLESYAGEDLLATTDVESYARIVEVRGGAAGATVVLEGGIEVPVAAVTAIRG
ncbi:flagellar hook capping FlgD N-terminal domain-containing protein [Rhodobacter ferrooxidans]|uniref:Basal-body rod modification protein FlgD n=1 Tax=Rhodobacter ferrooxidans TaxID=371731 RepID=C8RX78_9RHOB|nr:flagellar hook capping FlgD N-terminal domain-containing protein [Rhodobacter sp. SW2]EEW26603.1 flagellar hook capping protein [Rhodobacter sp. SW2]